MLIQLQSVTLFLVAEIQNKINDIMIFMSTCIVYETVHFLRIALVMILKESHPQASISIHRSLKQNRNKTNNVQGLGCSAQSKACPSKHLYCTLGKRFSYFLFRNMLQFYYYLFVKLTERVKLLCSEFTFHIQNPLSLGSDWTFKRVI